MRMRMCKISNTGTLICRKHLSLAHPTRPIGRRARGAVEAVHCQRGGDSGNAGFGHGGKAQTADGGPEEKNKQDQDSTLAMLTRLVVFFCCFFKFAFVCLASVYLSDP